MSMANVTIVGNLAKAPQLRTFQSGRVKADLILAVNSPYSFKSENAAETVDFYRVELWGVMAENAVRYLRTGNQIGASGRLILDHWIDQSGQARTTPVIAATQITYPPKGSRNNEYRRSESTQNTGQSTPAAILAAVTPVDLPPAEEAEPVASPSTPITDYAELGEGFVDEDAAADSLLAGARTVNVAEPRAHYRPRTRAALRRC